MVRTSSRYEYKGADSGICTLSQGTYQASTMQHARIPIEICERLIDTLNELRGPGQRPVSTLQACTLTCSAWLPRSRLNLYHTVVFSDPVQIDLFIRTLQVLPWLGEHVRVLRIGGPSQEAKLYLRYL